MSLETQTPIELLKRGQELEQKGRIKDAIACYQTALKKNPRLENANTSLGNAYVKDKDPSRAIKAYKRAIDVHREKYAYFNLGLLYFHLKMYTLAADYLQEAEKRGFNGPDTYHTLSKAYFFSKQFELAEKTLGKGYRKTSDPALGRALEKIKERKADLNRKFPGDKVLLAAIKKDPANLKNYNDIARHHFDENNFDEVERILKKAIENNPQSLVSYQNLCAFYFERTRWKDAADLLAKAITIRPDELSDVNINLYVNRAQALLQLGEKKDAIKALEKAYKMNPPRKEYIWKMIERMKKE